MESKRNKPIYQRNRPIVTNKPAPIIKNAPIKTKPIQKVKIPKEPLIHAYMPHSIQKFSLHPMPLGRKKIRAFNQGLKNLGVRRNIIIDSDILINEEDINDNMVSKATMIKKLEILKERLPDHTICSSIKFSKSKDINGNK